MLRRSDLPPLFFEEASPGRCVCLSLGLFHRGLVESWPTNAIASLSLACILVGPIGAVPAALTDDGKKMSAQLAQLAQPAVAILVRGDDWFLLNPHDAMHLLLFHFDSASPAAAATAERRQVPGPPKGGPTDEVNLLLNRFRLRSHAGFAFTTLQGPCKRRADCNTAMSEGSERSGRQPLPPGDRQCRSP